MPLRIRAGSEARELGEAMALVSACSVSMEIFAASMRSPNRGARSVMSPSTPVCFHGHERKGLGRARREKTRLEEKKMEWPSTSASFVTRRSPRPGLPWAGKAAFSVALVPRGRDLTSLLPLAETRTRKPPLRIRKMHVTPPCQAAAPRAGARGPGRRRCRDGRPCTRSGTAARAGRRGPRRRGRP